MPPTCTNGPSDMHATIAVKIHQLRGPRNPRLNIAKPMTPMAIHESDATFSSKLFGSRDNQPSDPLPHSGWSGFGISHAATSMPGALLRHNTCGPFQGRPALGFAIAYSTGPSVTAHTNTPTT